MEKNVLSAIGQYLIKSGARDLFFLVELDGPNVVDNKIMTGKYYVLSRQAFRILYEAVSRLPYCKFKEQFPNLFQNVANEINSSAYK